MPLHNLKDLFVHGLRDLYDAENLLLKSLPRFASAASNDELRLALEEHVTVTRSHVARLDRIFELLRMAAGRATPTGMKGLIREAEQFLEVEAEDAIRDAGLIAIIQRIEHYEIAAYCASRMFADTLGFDDIAWMLTETLEDEREADQRLTSLAESAVNLEAAEAPEAG